MEIVEVVEVKPVGDRALWLRFSDGQEGVRDCSDIVSEGGSMVEPLRDPALFRRVFLSFGAPSRPNGFDLDPINLHLEMTKPVRFDASQRNFTAERKAGPSPTISYFYGIYIRIYVREHLPPHCHAIYGEFEANVSIESGDVLEGRLPRKRGAPRCGLDDQTSRRTRVELVANAVGLRSRKNSRSRC